MTIPHQEREEQLEQLAWRSGEHLLRGEFAMGEKVAREFLELAGESSDDWLSLAHLRLGTILENVGRYEEALPHAEASRNTCPPESSGWCHAVGLIGNILLNQGELESARAQFLSALKFWPDCSFALCGLAAVESNLGDLDAFREYALRALVTASKSEDREHMAVANNLLGDAELDLGHQAQAEQHFRNALVISDEIGRRQGISIACQRLAMIESKREDYVASLEFGRRAVDAEIEMGRTSEITETCWRVVCGLRKAECPEVSFGAISLCKLAVEIETVPANKVSALQSEAWFNRNLKRFRQAKELLTQALSYLEESDEQTARTHGLIGILEEDQGLFKQAKASLTRSVKLAERHGHDKCLRAAYRRLGLTVKKTGDLIQARHYLQRALGLAQAASDDDAVNDIQNLLRLYRPNLVARFFNKMLRKGAR